MTSQAGEQSGGLTFTAYPGDGAVLLAFDLDQGMQQDLAGFAVEYTDSNGHTFPVLNRLSFAQPITSATIPEERRSRAAMQQATDAQPLQLKPRSATWAADYYNPASPRYRERTALA